MLNPNIRVKPVAARLLSCSSLLHFSSHGSSNICMVEAFFFFQLFNSHEENTCVGARVFVTSESVQIGRGVRHCVLSGLDCACSYIHICVHWAMPRVDACMPEVGMSHACTNCICVVSTHCAALFQAQGVCVCDFLSLCDDDCRAQSHYYTLHMCVCASLWRCVLSCFTAICSWWFSCIF